METVVGGLLWDAFFFLFFSFFFFPLPLGACKGFGAGEEDGRGE